MKRPAALVAVAVVVLLGAAIGWVVAYDAGQAAIDGAVTCAEGTVLTIRTTSSGAADASTTERTLELGDCEHLTDAAFAAAVAALATPDPAAPEPGPPAP